MGDEGTGGRAVGWTGERAERAGGAASQDRVKIFLGRQSCLVVPVRVLEKPDDYALCCILWQEKGRCFVATKNLQSPQKVSMPELDSSGLKGRYISICVGPSGLGIDWSSLPGLVSPGIRCICLSGIIQFQSLSINCSTMIAPSRIG